MADEEGSRAILDLLLLHDKEDLARAILEALAVAGAVARWEFETVEAVVAPLVVLDPAIVDPGSSAGMVWWRKVADEIGVEYGRE